ncbi:hypothetical protein [Maribacter litopenaei]|uniref:hypothetical protein n=1 Tax=Maribacter litopenaei TaxID=2976127 RepID=UPI0030844C70
MKKILILFLTIILFACETRKTNIQPKEGVWQARLEVKDHQILPFNFELYRTDDKSVSMKVLNGEETILVDEIYIEDDSILIKAPVFEGYISAKLINEQMIGKFVIESLD